MIHSQLLQTVYAMPWAILPEKLAVILAVVERYAAGEQLDPAEIQAITAAAAARPQAQPAGAVAVLPIVGTIIPRGDMFSESSGAVSAQGLQRRFQSLVADAGVSAIVLDIDSPGGAVQGIDELANTVYQARGSKPIVAVANHLAASAAYYVAAAADEVVVSPSAEVGSIGVFTAHRDMSAAMSQLGVKTTFISAGKFKTEGNPFEPLTDEARAAIQARVDDYYDAFVKAVARGRGVKAADVRSGFGEGRVVGAKQAVSIGMADRVGTLAETIDRLVRSKGPRSSVAAAVDADLETRQRRRRLAENS